MNEHGSGNHEPSSQEPSGNMSIDDALEARISRFLHKEAEKMHTTPTLHQRVMQKVSSSPSRRRHYITIAVLSSAAALILVLSGLIYFMNRPTIKAGIYYIVSKEITVAPKLANGGRLLSLDPTERRIIYQPSGPNNILYMADLTDPIQRNTLAVRYERDMAWAPNGSALVATVAPANTTHPLLALVPDGRYMRLLGHYNAQAANWLPTTTDKIMFAQLQHGQTELWSTKTSGAPTTLQITLPEQLLIRHMRWSPDGRYLALVVAQIGAVTTEALNLPAHAIYVMDFRTHKLTMLIAPGNFIIRNVVWSPAGHGLAYEQISNQHKIVLQTITIDKPGQHSSIVPRSQLSGWSWSADGRALVYSDGGKLRVHTFHGAPIIIPQQHLISPFWLKNGRILCMHITNGKGELLLLTPQKQ